MPYYRPKSGETTTLCVGGAHWVVDGGVETPEIPAIEDLVAAGSWERSAAPFPAKKAAIKLPDDAPPKAEPKAEPKAAAKPKKKGA